MTKSVTENDDMTNSTNLCHITPEYYAASILEHGILSSPDGYIYMFKDGIISHNSGKTIPMSDTIALLLRKIQDNHYFKFSIDPKGFETSVEPATVSAWGGGYHWKIRQECIKSEYIKVIDWRAAVKKEAIELRNIFIADKLGIPYQGQSYLELCQMIIQKESNGDKLTEHTIQDEWEHEIELIKIPLNTEQIMRILRIRGMVYDSPYWVNPR